MRAAVMLLVAATATVATMLPVPAQAKSGYVAFPEIDIRFNPDGVAAQCGGMTGDQWSIEPAFTDPIRFDTDSRPGGCQLAFGIHDPDDDLAGTVITYTFQASTGGNPGQCGNQGVHQMPISRTSRTFGAAIRIDTDNRPGGCNLTFDVSSPNGLLKLVFEYVADGDAAQCRGAAPPGVFNFAGNDHPAKFGIDTDDRPGGCRLRVRINQF